MLNQAKLVLSAAIVLGTASVAFAAGQDLASEPALGRNFGQQVVVPAHAYASVAKDIVIRRGPVADANRPDLTDRQSAWYRL